MSQVFAKPEWQLTQTLPGSFRQVPDVAVNAAWSQVGYVISGSWTAADGDAAPPQPEGLSISGGTSAATPSFAGILALVNQAVAAKNPGNPVGLGNANPILYAINASTKGGAAPAFHDITTGSDIVPCTQGSPDCPSTAPYQFGYEAGPRFDMVTGLGSVDVGNLVAAWEELAPTSTTLAITPSGTHEGSAVSLSATVASNATSTPLGGAVLFYLEAVNDGGPSNPSLMASGTIAPGTTGGKMGGTATATVVVPPGLSGAAKVVAFYSGDSHYLASWSKASSVTATSSFAVSPAAITLSPNEPQTFSTTGGVPPVQWTVVRDATCDPNGDCAKIDSVSATAGAFQAGPVAGRTILEAVDADGAEAIVTITVTGTAIDGGSLPPGGTAAAGCRTGATVTPGPGGRTPAPMRTPSEPKRPARGPSMIRVPATTSPTPRPTPTRTPRRGVHAVPPDAASRRSV